MPDHDQTKRDRLKSVLTALLQHQLGHSLASVEDSLKSWRQGDIGVFEAHAEILKHAIRAERMAGRIAQASHEPSPSVLRDAFDAGLLTRDQFRDMVGKEPAEVEPASMADEQFGLPMKQSFVRDLLDHGPVLVHVDARSKGVSVPIHLKKEPKLVLRFGYDLKPPIHDLCVDDNAISGTLTFKGMPHLCILPWSAIYAAVSEAEDQRGMVWPEDVPEEVLETMVSQENGRNASASASPSGKSRSSAEPDQPPTQRRASHLKLVE